jgi:unsaturated rhamnogalacturonyl hydrolase
MERMTLPPPRTACVVLLLLTFACGCAAKRTKPEKSDQPWSLRMSHAIVEQHPESAKWELDDKGKRPKWSYATAFATHAVATVGVSTGEAKFIDYGKTYVDTFIDADGNFKPKVYKLKDYKLDDVQPGRLLLLLLKQTNEPRYRVAADTLVEQLKTQPRTSDGGYWHKQIYTHEMWLDGIFMDCPFMAEYAQAARQPAWMDEAAKQITVMASHARDPKTGLYFHGWDESRTERWANKQTGLSPHVWGRAVGWFVMGIVETLERLPQEHPRRSEIVEIYRNLARAIADAQDPASGVWWQVMDQPGRRGNYLESSASSMFVFALAKGRRLGLLDGQFDPVIRRGYGGILEQFIWTDDRGRLVLTDTCKVAGLGGKKNYRDGSFRYYISEPRISNDPKGVAPFILASLEMERAAR